jgi:hypothetical protein
MNSFSDYLHGPGSGTGNGAMSSALSNTLKSINLPPMERLAEVYKAKANPSLIDNGATQLGDFSKGLKSPAFNFDDLSFMEKMFGNDKFGGLAAPILSLGNGIMSGYLGLQELDVAKDSLAFQKNAFSKQFENQRKLTNEQLKWQHKAREDYSPGSGGQLVQL